MEQIGTDESGKGDYFGPLVVAAVYLDQATADELLALGVKDCKKVSDKKTVFLSKRIMETAPYSVVWISPKRYNQIYGNFENLNILLAWAHAKAIDEMIVKVGPKQVVVDKFAKPSILRGQLKPEHRKLDIIQKTQAEVEPAVAAASIVARAKYLGQLAALSAEYNIELPKGATHVVAAAKRFIEIYGFKELPNVAKIHFKTTKGLAQK